MVLKEGRNTLVAYITGDRGLCCPNRYVALEFTLLDGELEQTGLIDLPEPADVADAVEEDAQATAGSAVPPLKWSALQNDTYPVAGWREGVWNLVTLVDGSFWPQDPNQWDPSHVWLQSMSAFGDLDGDEIEDVAVILVVNYGGNSG